MSTLREPDYELIARIRAEELDAKALVIGRLQRKLQVAEKLSKVVSEITQFGWSMERANDLREVNVAFRAALTELRKK